MNVSTLQTYIDLQNYIELSPGITIGKSQILADQYGIKLNHNRKYCIIKDDPFGFSYKSSNSVQELLKEALNE